MNRKPDLQKPTAGSRPPDLKRIMKATALFSSALALVGMTAAHAQVTTAPVGYVSYNCANNSDLLVGVPLTQSPVFASAVNSVTVGQVGFASTVPDLSSGPHFLMVTNDGDALEGQWFTITSSDASSVTVAEDLAALGLDNADTISIYPFWTLDTLFPSGGDIPGSSDVLNPAAVIITNNVAASGANLPAGPTYLYHTGGQLTPGWYNANDLGGGSKGDTILNPETYLTIRNNSGSAATITFSGTVPTEPIANNIVSSSSDRQDNQVLNPYPIGLTLANSNLVSSGAIAASSDLLNPVDRLFVYSTTASGLRPAPTKTFIYHSGEQLPAGWYDENNLGGGSQGAYELPAGCALIIRKAQGSDASNAWSPALPYTP